MYMPTHTITDFETFMIDDGFQRIFRMLEKRQPGDWTPKELSEKYADQSHYKSDIYNLIKIVEVIELPNKDLLIGYKLLLEWDDLEDENFEKLPIQYRNLREMELNFYPEDMLESSWL